MPTGYTAAVVDGEITELKPFIMQLARGMGALVMMRDDPHDAPIPERFEPYGYHQRELVKAMARQNELLAMTAEEKQLAANKWNAEIEEVRKNAVKKNEETRIRLNDMIAKVEAWNGAPEGIKEFALQQLNSTLEFDVSDNPLKYYEKPCIVEEWYNSEINKVQNDINYHSNKHKEDIERTESRNQWLAQLRASLELNY